MGLPLGKRERTYNTRFAQELAKWAESKGKGDAFHKAVFQAYYVNGEHIGKVERLIEVAESAGLDGEEARRVLESGAFRQMVEQAAPGVTYVSLHCSTPGEVERLHGDRVVGAQPLEVLERFLRSHGVKRRRS